MTNYFKKMLYSKNMFIYNVTVTENRRIETSFNTVVFDHAATIRLLYCFVHI